MTQLMEFTGPRVAGAAFIVARHPGGDDMPASDAWLAEDGTFTATMDAARRFYTTEDGYALIERLQPGDYRVHEYSAEYGAPSAIIQVTCHLN